MSTDYFFYNRREEDFASLPLEQLTIALQRRGWCVERNQVNEDWIAVYTDDGMATQSLSVSAGGDVIGFSRFGICTMLDDFLVTLNELLAEVGGEVISEHDDEEFYLLFSE